MPKDQSTKPKGKSKYAQRRLMSIESTHPHSPAVSSCQKCRPGYRAPAEQLTPFVVPAHVDMSGI